MKNHLKWSAKRGFTIVELLLTLALFGMTAAAGYSAVRVVIVRLNGIMADVVNHGEESIALASLSRSLRGAFLETDDENSFFIGRPSSKKGFHEITFTTRDIGGGVKSVTFEASDASYFDGVTWRPQWGWDAENRRAVRGIRGLPVAVRVRVGESERVMPVLTAVLNCRS